MQTRESVLNTNKEFKNLEIETFLKINTKDNAIMKTKRLSEVQAQIQGGGVTEVMTPPKLSYYLQKFDQDFNAEITEKQIWEVPQGVIGLREQRWHHALSWCPL